MQPAQPLTFDRYSVDLHNGQLWRGKRVLPLTSQTFAVLRYLLEHAGQVVTKAELFDALWPGTAVSDGALTFCIVELRKALGDNAKRPKFIETVHRRGYRFLPAITTAASVQSSMFQVQGSQSPLRIPQSVITLVGREPDLTQLHLLLAKALRGERQLVFVTGEAGIGKTSLVEAFLSGIRQRGMDNGEEENQKAKGKGQKEKTSPRHPTPWISWGQCIEQYGPGEPYMPLLEALGRLCRAPDGKQLVTLLGHHAPTWLVQLPSLLNAAELDALQRQTQGATRERMLREMGEALDAITAERLLVLWLEDLHWSDASTLELLALLARRREPARLLVIGTYRPVEVIVQEHPLRTVKQELQLHGLCEELPLGLLSEAQVGEYLAARVQIPSPVSAGEGQGEGLSSAALQNLARVIHKRTDGNPLFMVTAADDLVSQGVLGFSEGQGTLPEDLSAVALRVPATVQQLITQHLERLSPEERRLLEVASVAGMEFSAAAVAAGIGSETEGIEERCEGLAQQGRFLRTSGTVEWPDGAVAARYSFLHALYQEVLYTRLSAGRRRRLHQQLGEREEQAYGERAREIAAELAVHFEQARDYRKAVRYLRQAGQSALRRSAHQEAMALFTKGLDLLSLLPDSRQRDLDELRLQIHLGTTLITTKGYGAREVEQAYTRAYALSQRVGEPPQLFAVLGGLSSLYLERLALKRSREFAEQLLHLAHKAQDPILLVWAHRTLGTILYHTGEFLLARHHYEESLALYESHQHRAYGFAFDPGVTGLSQLAWTLFWLGYPDQALQRSREAVSLARELSHPHSLMLSLGAAAVIHWRRGEQQMAQELEERGYVLATEQGFTDLMLEATFHQSFLLVMQGQAARGIKQMCQGLAALRARGTELNRPYFLLLLAEAHGKVGQVTAGLSIVAEALATVHQSGERMYEVESYRIKGELLLGAGSQRAKVKSQKSKMPNSQSPIPDPWSEAEACFLKAIDIARHQQAKSLELRAVMSLARLWQQQGKRHEARTMLAEIYNWFTEGFDTKDLQEAKALLEELRD